MTDTEEPWSSYRTLNAGLNDLVGMLKECDSAYVGTETLALCQDLAQQAKTVETAAMVRAMEYVDRTVMRDASERAGNDENVVYTVSQARADLRRIIDGCSRS